MMSLNRPEPLGMASVAALLAMDQTTLTAALKPLQRRGFIDIATDPVDRRASLIKLTPKGRRLLARAVPIWKSTHREVEGLLPDGDPDRLRQSALALLTISRLGKSFVFPCSILFASPHCGVRRSAEPIGCASPALRRDRRNIVSRGRPYRCGIP